MVTPSATQDLMLMKCISGTLYAFAYAIDINADVIEMDTVRVQPVFTKRVGN